MPTVGERLILGDGRRFVLTMTDAGERGWWFSAQCQDGRSRIAGNLVLEWDEREHVWRPTTRRARTVTTPAARPTAYSNKQAEERLSG
jgi:hypothetical protein